MAPSQPDGVPTSPLAEHEAAPTRVPIGTGSASDTTALLGRSGASGEPSPLAEDFPAVRTLFIGIGAQKAATTWLARALSRCPDCHVPAMKELHYWHIAMRNEPVAPRLARRRAALFRARLGVGVALARPWSLPIAWWHLNFARQKLATVRDPSLKRYAARLMAGWRGEPVVGELTPNYAELGSEAFAAMARAHPDTRFIFVMRDPVARMWSGVRHEFRGLRASVDIDRRIGEAFAEAVADPSSGHARRSDYRATIEALENAVPKRQIAYMFYETLRSERELARLAAFLGIGRIAGGEGRRINRGVRPGLEPDPSVLRAARATLDPTYRYVAERFGARVPEQWRLERAAIKGS